MDPNSEKYDLIIDPNEVIFFLSVKIIVNVSNPR
jgi:hypothetical protein